MGDMKEKEPPTPNELPASVPIKVPVNIIRWLLYSITLWGILGPFYRNPLNLGQWISAALILGWFASQLNAIINKK
jgi:hypothetical protein